MRRQYATTDERRSSYQTQANKKNETRQDKGLISRCSTGKRNEIPNVCK